MNHIHICVCVSISKVLEKLSFWFAFVPFHLIEVLVVTSDKTEYLLGNLKNLLNWGKIWCHETWGQFFIRRFGGAENFLSFWIFKLVCWFAENVSVCLKLLTNWIKFCLLDNKENNLFIIIIAHGKHMIKLLCSRLC